MGLLRLTLAEIREAGRKRGRTPTAWLEDLRWPNGSICPTVGRTRPYFLKPKNGTSRANGPKRTMSQRRVWKCAKCRKQFSVLTGTIFHGTKGGRLRSG